MGYSYDQSPNLVVINTFSTRRIPRRNCILYLQRSAKLVVISFFSLWGDFLVVIVVPLATIPCNICVHYLQQGMQFVVLHILVITKILVIIICYNNEIFCYLIELQRTEMVICHCFQHVRIHSYMSICQKYRLYIVHSMFNIAKVDTYVCPHTFVNIC